MPTTQTAPEQPPNVSARAFVRSYCNYVEVQPTVEAGVRKVNYENSFIISSWCPSCLQPEVRHPSGHGCVRPMLVSYNCREKLKDCPEEHFERNVTGQRVRRFARRPLTPPASFHATQRPDALPHRVTPWAPLTNPPLAKRNTA